MMELFTLGADRGAYTEDDVREQARALTGWTARLGRQHRDDQLPLRGSPARPRAQDGSSAAAATGAGRTPAASASRTGVHASFFVTKLWSYFIPTPPSAGTLKALIGIYKKRDYAIRPVLEAILMHPDFYRGPPMVKPPVVYLAGLLRSLGRGIDTESWVWLSGQIGQ